MTTKLQKLRAERDKNIAEATAIEGKYPADKRMPAAESARMGALLDRVEEIDREIGQINDAMQDDSPTGGGMETWRAPDGSRTPVMRNSKDFHRHYRQQVTDRGTLGANTEFGMDDFIRGVAGMSSTPAVRAALSEGTNTAGGYTVPSLLMPRMLEALVPNSSLLQAGAGIVPLDIGGSTFTLAGINAIPAAAWRAESAAVAQSDPTFRAIIGTPHSLAFYFRVSRELLADGRNIESALYTAIGQSFAKELDRAGLRGSGAAPEPRGVLNTVGIQAVANGANGLSLTDYSNFFTGLTSILSADAPPPTAAIMNPRSLTKLGGLKDTTNQPLRVPQLLEPVKLLTSSQIPINLVVGTSNDCSEIYIGDFSTVLFLMRESPSIQLLKELYAATGEVGFVAHVRADIAVLYPSALAVVTGVRA